MTDAFMPAVRALVEPLNVVGHLMGDTVASALRAIAPSLPVIATAIGKLAEAAAMAGASLLKGLASPDLVGALSDLAVS